MRQLVQYNFSGDEMTRVVATEQMGDAHSLLSSNELIESVRGPQLYRAPGSDPFDRPFCRLKMSWSMP